MYIHDIKQLGNFPESHEEIPDFLQANASPEMLDTIVGTNPLYGPQADAFESVRGNQSAKLVAGCSKLSDQYKLYRSQVIEAGDLSYGLHGPMIGVYTDVQAAEIIAEDTGDGIKVEPFVFGALRVAARIHGYGDTNFAP